MHWWGDREGTFHWVCSLLPPSALEFQEATDAFTKKRWICCYVQTTTSSTSKPDSMQQKPDARGRWRKQFLHLYVTWAMACLHLQVAQLPLSLPQDEWQHICVSWTLRDGVWKAYQGGKLKGRGEGLAAWHPIKPGGVLILGQEQVRGRALSICWVIHEQTRVQTPSPTCHWVTFSLAEFYILIFSCLGVFMVDSWGSESLS